MKQQKNSNESGYKAIQSNSLEYLQAYAAYVGPTSSPRGFKSNKQKARYSLSKKRA